MQVNEDVYFVILTKDEGSGLGFSIAGGVDLEQKYITVNLSLVTFQAVKAHTYLMLYKNRLFVLHYYIPLSSSQCLTFLLIRD